MIRLRVTLTIQAETPLSVGAGGSAGTIADKAIVRDGWGRPLIPGSQVKGRVRHAAEAISSALGLALPQGFDDDTSPENVIRTIFGSPHQRSPLRFLDLIAFTVEPQEIAEPTTFDWQQIGTLRPSVSLNRQRGTAEDARLLFQEVAPAQLQFGSYPYAAISGELPTIEHVALLWAAICTTTRWGGAKSRGLGWAQVQAIIEADGIVIERDALADALRRLPSVGEAP